MITIFLSTSQLARHYGVHPQTIRRWQKIGLIKEHHRTLGTHRRFVKPIAPCGEVVGYVRVSSHDQKKDLACQREAMSEKCKPLGIHLDKIIQDIGSGLNYKKTGFRKLVTAILAGKISHLVLMRKDRLLRFGSEIVFSICQAMNVEVTILESSPATSPIEQFAVDLVEIVTVFSSKLYGMRSHSNKKVLNAQLCSEIPATV